MLEFRNISFSYGDKKILSDFTLTVKDGQRICLKGSSGCGKTTVLRLASGLEKPDSGSILSPEKIAYVFQEDRLVPHLSIMQNIMLTAPKGRKGKAEVLIKEAGLDAVKNSRPDSLSGGMKRRAAIVRAVVCGGDAILLDEPFNGLDRETKTVMAEMIKREYDGKPVLMVSHIEEDAELMNAEIKELRAIG